MVYYHCECCNYDCRNNQSYMTHIKSKRHNIAIKLSKGEPIAEKIYECDLCNKSYNLYNSFYYHKKICAIRREEETMQRLADIIIKNCKTTVDSPIDSNSTTADSTTISSHNTTADSPTISSHNTTADSHNTTTTTTSNSHNPTTITTSNSNNTTTTNNNITLVMPFGKVDLSMITDEMKMQLLSTGHCAVGNLMDMVYSFPQNNNIHLYDKRNKLVHYVTVDNKIKVAKLNTIIALLAESNAERVDEFYEQFYDDMDYRNQYTAKILHNIHSNESKRADKLLKYEIIVECIVNEIAPVAKKNIEKLRKQNSTGD